MAVDISNDRKGTAAFFKAQDLQMPVAFDTAGVALQYGVVGTPTTFILDQEGTILWRHLGYLPGEEVALQERIVSLLSPDL